MMISIHIDLVWLHKKKKKERPTDYMSMNDGNVHVHVYIERRARVESDERMDLMGHRSRFYFFDGRPVCEARGGEKCEEANDDDYDVYCCTKASLIRPPQQSTIARSLLCTFQSLHSHELSRRP